MSYIFCNIRRAKAPSVWAFPQQSEEEIILTELRVGNKAQERQEMFWNILTKRMMKAQQSGVFMGRYFR